MARRPPRLGLGLDFEASASSLRTSMSTDLGASYNLTDEGVRLLSTSAREFHLNAGGHETRTKAERMKDTGNNRGLGDRMGRAGERSAMAHGRPGRSTRDDAQHQFDNDKSPGVSQSDILPFDTIGAGAGGSVRRAIHTSSNAFVALKVLTVFDREKRKQLVNELRLLCDLPNGGSKNIITFHGAYYDSTKNTVNLTLEFVDGGSLEGILKNLNGKPVTVGVIGDLCAQVANGLEYLHEHARLVHRDIKPGNILVKRTGEAKITDFGIVAQSKLNESGTDRDHAMDTDATSLTGKPSNSSFKSNHSIALKSFKGSLRYMSPERVERLPYGRAADIWSLGMTLSECALGKYPYEDEDGGLLGLALRIAEGQEVLPLRNEGSQSFPPEFLELVTNCVKKNPGNRPTATMLRNDLFVISSREMSKRNPDDSKYSLGAFVRSNSDSSQELSRIQNEAEAFLTHYTRLLLSAKESKNQNVFAQLYRKPSCLTSVNGVRAMGGEAISNALLTGAGDVSSSTTDSVTALPGGVEGGILIVEHGTLTFSGTQTTKKITRTFLLLRVHEGWGGKGAAKTGGTFYVRNQIEKWVQYRG